MAFQIKFHQIRAFVEVAREGSIRGASRSLAISQPALTKAIKELEEGLSAQLFVRRRQGVALTDNGESFYQHASLILEELRAAQDELLQRQGEQAGQINIGLGASVARSLMPSVICRFHQQHPQVKVRIMEGQLLAMINELRQGELDFTINTYYPGPYDHEFSFEKLFEKPFAVFARAGHPAAQATSLVELMDHHWTMPTPRGSYFKQLQDRFNQAGLAPKVNIVCETFSSCISLVVKSDFLSILPVELGNDPLLADKLMMIPVREALPTAAYFLIQRRDTRQTPLTASLITLFRRQSRQWFPEPPVALTLPADGDKRIEGGARGGYSSWRQPLEESP